MRRGLVALRRALAIVMRVRLIGWLAGGHRERVHSLPFFFSPTLYTVQYSTARSL